MDGIQQTVYEALQRLAEAVESGNYGMDDEFDNEKLRNDMDEIASSAC